MVRSFIYVYFHRDDAHIDLINTFFICTTKIFQLNNKRETEINNHV